LIPPPEREQLSWASMLVLNLPQISGRSFESYSWDLRLIRPSCYMLFFWALPIAIWKRKGRDRTREGGILK
jgi:hypothetical protein